MNLSLGIVGLPNVGKSTLFNALLKKQVAEASNYPFTTIDPNIGVVEVPDERLQVLSDISHSQKIIPAAVKFIDIAGIVRNAHKGEGLGNQFLANIREVDAIVHVVRAFSATSVVKTGDNPESDLETIETELQLADLSTIEKQQPPKINADKKMVERYEVVKKLQSALNDGESASEVQLSEEEKFLVKDLNLLTMKPKIIVLNIDEDRVGEYQDTANTIHIAAKIEAEIAEMNAEEAKEYMETYGLNESGLSKLIRTGYNILGLISFLTTGEKETRAWTLALGTKAPQAAGTIHTDFEQKFIKAEVVAYNDFVQLGGWKQAREAGKARMEGKEYCLRDGDVVEFKVGS